MLAVDEWDSVSLAGAFLIGAILATIAVLRVVRAVTNMFEDVEVRRSRLRRRRDDDDSADE